MITYDPEHNMNKDSEDSEVSIPIAIFLIGTIVYLLWTVCIAI